MSESSIEHTDGHYEVSLPFKEDNTNLPNNYGGALKQFLFLEKRLLCDERLCRRYTKGMQEYLNLGHARKLTPSKVLESIPGKTWYNPQHPVIYPKNPEKLHIVFNLATVFSGVSLNSKLLKGPDLLTSLVSVLLRFRNYPVAVVADMERISFE